MLQKKKKKDIWENKVYLKFIVWKNYPISKNILHMWKFFRNIKGLSERKANKRLLNLIPMQLHKPG